MQIQLLKQIFVLSYILLVFKWNTLTWSSSSISVRMQQNPESYLQIPILVKEEGYQKGAHNLFLFILFHVLDHYLPPQETNCKKSRGTKKLRLKTGFMLISYGSAYGS